MEGSDALLGGKSGVLAALLLSLFHRVKEAPAEMYLRDI